MPPDKTPIGPQTKHNLYRGVTPIELRANEDEPAGPPILEGHFAKFNEWAVIDSAWEGKFLERIAPGAFSSTFENSERVQLLFQHGQDPDLGDKPIGSIQELREDDEGAFYQARLYDGIPPLVMSGLADGKYGASFRFSVVREKVDAHPKRTTHNPEALPERTIQQAHLFEFGPVTFPAYTGATAMMRSLTDTYSLGRIVQQPEKLSKALDNLNAQALPGLAVEPHSDEGTREAKPEQSPLRGISQGKAVMEAIAEGLKTPPPSTSETTPMTDMTIEARETRQTEIRSRLTSLDNDYAGDDLPDEIKREWDGLNAELAANQKVLDAVAMRRADLERAHASKPQTVRFEQGVSDFQIRVQPGADIYDQESIRNAARSQGDEVRMLKDNAKRANEIASFPGARDRSAAQAQVEWLLDNVVEYGHEKGTLARRILATGRPIYDQAFGKALANTPLDNEEARALSLAASAGGNAVTFDLDPTIMGTSARQVNPIRSLARVIPITGDEWRGVTSGAITTAYAAEATETTDNAPTLTQPAISTEKAQAFVPFSIEIDMDWAGMRSEMSQLLQESKDDLEAVKFTLGSGTNEPFGVIVGATTTITATTPQTTDAEDFYRLTAALPERYQPRASILAHRGIYNLIRQFVLTGQSNPWKDIDEATVTDGRAGTFLGYPAYMNSAMDATPATNNEFAIIGDFSRYVIVDRVGLSVEILPHLLGTNRRPTGERGLYAFWRNGAKVINADAFRTLLGVV